MNRNESMTLTIKGITLDDVYFENLGSPDAQERITTMPERRRALCSV